MKYLFQLFKLVLTTCILSNHLNAYKLNVPKVLLPFHSSKLISFVLEAKSETADLTDEPCFVWSSSRPDIVSITPIYDKSKQKQKEEGCSSKATVSAVSKHSKRLTSIILAKETRTDKLIRCDVIVDKINSIRIKHTTTHLYLEDSPECFTVEALDDEGNTFSSVDGLPFEWTIINDINEINSNKTIELEDSRQVLRISKFIDSEYEVSESIKQLEIIGLSGHKILIEGLKTGTANVQSKLLDPVYKDELTLKTSLVRLLVVANILLEPSYPIYLLIGSVVKYNVFLIKQTSIEKVNLPSLQYYFESHNSSTADLYQLDTSGSSIVGIELGSTEIVLIDRNMKENKLISSSTDQNMKPIVPPPTALVHVVMPDVLVFTIKNWRSSWILEVGRTYEIMILIYTDKRQQIYPSDNLRIEAVFDSLKFKSNFESRNGSYHIVTGMQKGVTQAQASLIGTFNDLKNNEIQPFSYVAQGQIDIELLDPIDLNPKILIFALCQQQHQQQQQFITKTNTNAYEYQLKATGGSGTYYWQSRNTTIANVNAQGIVRSTAMRIGLTDILVTDTRNIDIQAKSLVYVLEPIDLQILACPVETQVNRQLYLNIKMNAYLSNHQNNKVHINDCSRLQFDVTIQDEKIFKYVSIESPSKFINNNMNVDDTACAILVLDALLVGQTSIKLTAITTNEKKPSTFIQLTSNEMLIGSYTALKSYKSQLVLSRGSSIQINLFDGPLYSSSSNTQSDSITSYQSKTHVSDQNLVEINQIDSEYHMPNKYSYIVKCNHLTEVAEDSLAEIKISLLHKVTNYNKCPLNFDYDLKVRCARPHSIHLNQLMVFNDENGNDLALPANLKWKCPIKYSANQIAAHYMRPLYIQTVVRDSLENVFDNFTSLNLEWLIQDKNLLEKSSSESSLSSILVAAVSTAQDNSGIYFFNNFNNELAANSQRIYYQTFMTKSKFGKSKLLVKLNNQLENELVINFVSDVKITPDSLTIFNHPSNVVTLNLLDGSGHYHAEIETIRVQATDELTNVLKINQINENSIVVSPLVNNGLTYLHIFDYCVPPEMLKTNINLLKSMPNSNRGFLTQWRPSTNAKIQVSGINLILTNYEDDKVEVKKTLKIYVQISDSNGNLIKNSYFPLMNLNGRLLSSLANSKTDETTELVTIELASPDEYEKSKLNNQEKEFTAIYILTAIRPGLINIQFEAKSDGYQLKADNLNMIRSHLKEIQIYVPLNVQPKYIELITGSYYQIVITGGPNSPDATISYELSNHETTTTTTTKDKNKKTTKKIIDVNTDGIINAISIGQMRIDVKSIGYICPPSAMTATSIQLRCKTEDRIKRVYSQDFLLVKVVELHSVQIIVPLKTIKVGNEMPIYLMGNEKTLTPLSFGSCNRLKFAWKINDQQIGSLTHQLLSFNEADIKNLQLIPKNSDDLLLFENSFVLRFAALRSGKIKISVRVELDGGVSHLTDSVDVTVIENAYFTHFSADYYMFKYPGLKKQLKSLSHFIAENNEELLIEKYKEKSILITPGAQFQVKTNFDKSAFKINYHLTFNDLIHLNEDDFDQTNQKFCNNNTVQISEDGLITIARMQQYDLKNLKHCSVNLLVTIFINEMNQQQQQQQQNKKSNVGNKETKYDFLLKKQTLLYEIKVKPITYSMLKLSKKRTSLQNTLIRLDKQSLLKNKLQINSDGFKLQWHLKHFDDLGDLFDVVSVSTRYTMNRHDLTDFSQINSNVFIYDASGNGKLLAGGNSINEKEESTNNSNQDTTTTSSSSSLSLQSDSVELSFLIRTLKPGRLVMEISPFAANLFDSKDYLGISLADLGENDFIRNLDFVKRVDANIGDFICLNEKMSIEDDYDINNNNNNNNNRLETKHQLWSTLNSNVISLISTESEYNTHYTSIGVCINEGQAILKKGSTSDSSSKIVDINVKSIDKIKFIPSHSARFISNMPPSNIIDSFNMVQFQTNLNIQSIQNQNCSDLFEKISVKIKEQIPLKCLASLFTKSGQRLAYLDRLIKTNLIFTNRNWHCDITFVSESTSILYDLIDANQKRSVTNSINENEPVSIKVIVDTKDSQTDIDSINELKSFELPFLPAYYVQTKQIQLPITRNAFYLQALKIKNQKEFSLNEHFNLIIYSTHQLHSYLVLTTNCPSLIQIKPLIVSTESNNAVLKITYDIVTSDDLFDLNSYASILQEKNGNLYVQITCSLTQQTERVPIKFQFGVGDSNIEFNNYAIKSKTSSSPTSSLFSWFFELTPNEITTCAFMISLLFLTILFFIRTKQQTIAQQTAEQMATVAAATASACCRKTGGGSGVKENSSFNPYRYFTSFLDTGSTAQVYARDPRLNVSGSPLNITSPSNFSYIQSPLQNSSGSGSPLKRSPQKQSYMSNYQLLNTTPSSSPLINQSLFRSPRFSPASSTGEQVRLFSVDADAVNTSNMYENRYRNEDNY